MNKKSLIKDAKSLFYWQHEDYPEDYGYCYVEVWKKPFFFSYRPEVVFGKTQEAVDAFIKVQRIARWSIEFFLVYAFLFVPLAFLAPLFGKIEWLMWLVVVSLCALIANIGVYLYGKPKEKLYKDKVVWYTFEK